MNAPTSRRRWLSDSAAFSLTSAGAALGATALAGCATADAGPAGAGAGASTGSTKSTSFRSPFAVAATTIPIAGSDMLYPVRRIYCIGRNYAAHAREMGSDPTREPPFFFQKPTDSIQYVAPGTVADHPYPTLTTNYHYEAELVCALGTGGRNISQADALSHVFGYSLGLDMTRRDLQRAMGDEKKPWEIGKSFDRSAPIGQIHPVASVGHFLDGAIWLKVNGVTKQNATLRHMIWSVAEQIARLSQAFELFPGDIIYSGTPENVGPVVPGDRIDIHIDKLPDLAIRIT